MSSVPVTVANFTRAESDRMFSAFAAGAGGLNRLHHTRLPTPLDQQTVIRMNRDTLYSAAVVDLDGEPRLTIPDAEDRYLSVMVVNQDHYINQVFHEPGVYTLRQADFDTRYVAIAARILVDPVDEADVARVNSLQDQFDLSGAGDATFEMPDYDKTTFDAVRAAVLELGKWAPSEAVRFGRKEEVDPVQHLIATASGWGGLPRQEAVYNGVQPRLPVGHYLINVPAEVPVDAFWSISVYNEAGFFEPNDRNAYSVNSVTASRNHDRSVTVHLGGCDQDPPNCIPITDGWNYVVRMYRPRREILDGTWTFPALESA
jgi:hypothetical protein